MVTKEPTTSSTGEKTFTCGNCKATKVETLDKLPVAEPENGNNTGSGSNSGGYDYWDGGDTATAPETISLVMQIDSRNMEYNKESFVYDVAPVLQENRTLVPIRVIVEKLGGKVDWHEDGRTALLYRFVM